MTAVQEFNFCGHPATLEAEVPVTVHHPDGPVTVLAPVAAVGMDSERDRVDVLLDADATVKRLARRLAQDAEEPGARHERSGVHAADVEVAALRDEARRLVSKGAETWTSLAQRAGYFRKMSDGRSTPDTQRLRRTLGVAGAEKRFVRYNTAVVLAHALNLDPVEAGF